MSLSNVALENFLADDQLNKEQTLGLIALAKDIKNNPANYAQALAGKSVAMILKNRHYVLM